MEAEDLRPPAPFLPRWPPTQIAWLPRVFSANPLSVSLLPTLIWGSRDGARMSLTSRDKSWSSFWYPSFVFRLGALGLPRVPLGLGVGRETDPRLHPSSNGFEDGPAWGPPGA